MDYAAVLNPSAFAEGQGTRGPANMYGTVRYASVKDLFGTSIVITSRHEQE